MKTFLAVLIIAILLGCGPKGPHWEKRCTRSTTVTSVGVAVTTSGAVPVVTTANVCLEYDSVWVQGDSLTYEATNRE